MCQQCRSNELESKTIRRNKPFNLLVFNNRIKLRWFLHRRNNLELSGGSQVDPFGRADSAQVRGIAGDFITSYPSLYRLFKVRA